MKRLLIKKDLRTLSGLLSNWGKNVKNAEILQSITIGDVNSCLNYSIFDANPLKFINIDLDRHCIPVGIEKLPPSDIEITAKLTATYSEKNEDHDDFDPLESLGVNIMIDANYCNGSDVLDASCSWHLDRGAPTDAVFSHPMYHMNFGGSSMVKQGNVYGKLLLLTSPRIIHPPMDIILSCDFIIRNFYTKKNHIKITQLPAYKSLLESAKTRYWKPYTKAFSSKWNDNGGISNLSYMDLVGH